MKKNINIKTIILFVYICLFLGIYLWFVHPVFIKPTQLTATNVPSLSISRLKEADSLFSSYEKGWEQFPTEPDISSFSFGQTDPI